MVQPSCDLAANRGRDFVFAQFNYIKFILLSSILKLMKKFMIILLIELFELDTIYIEQLGRTPGDLDACILYIQLVAPGHQCPSLLYIHTM